MAGPAQILYEHLTASGTSLYSLIAGRCWYGSVPENVSWENESAALIFNLTGDGANASGGRRECLASIRIYGGSRNADDVETVAEALFSRLGHARRSVVASGILERGALVGGRQCLVDPDTEWPYAVADYAIDVS